MHFEIEEQMYIFKAQDLFPCLFHSFDENENLALKDYKSLLSFLTLCFEDLSLGEI